MLQHYIILFCSLDAIQLPTNKWPKCFSSYVVEIAGPNTFMRILCIYVSVLSNIWTYYVGNIAVNSYYIQIQGVYSIFCHLMCEIYLYIYITYSYRFNTWTFYMRNIAVNSYYIQVQGAYSKFEHINGKFSCKFI